MVRFTWQGVGSVLMLWGGLLFADESPAAAAPAAAPAAAAARPVPLNPQGTVLLDRAGRRLILKTEVVLRSGLLEMLVCKAHTKEHESILAVDSDAFVIHGGLLALGARVGTPVRYEPEFRAPTGQAIRVVLRWRDAEGREQTAPAQSWVRHAIHRYFSAPMEKLPEGFTLPKDSELRYDDFNKQLLWFGPMTAAQRDGLLKLSADAGYRKAINEFFTQSQSRPLEAGWVFAGSGFYDLGDGTKRYQAEDGNVICVANFGDAMLDLSIPSSASNDGLMFEPYTERIPPVGTAVEVDLVPVVGAAEGQSSPPSGDGPPGSRSQP